MLVLFTNIPYGWAGSMDHVPVSKDINHCDWIAGRDFNLPT